MPSLKRAHERSYSLKESDELILKRKDVRFNGSKPSCPKCKTEKDEVILTNVTLKKFKCLRCNTEFSFSDY